MNVSRHRLLLVSAILLWVAAIILGARELWHYSRTPGKLAATPELWPEFVGAHVKDKPALVLFLHPECPCSRATVTELSRIMTQTPRELEVMVYFLELDDENWSSEDGSLWRSVSRLPGVKLAHDTGGRLAKRFGVQTSGTILLYDSDGRLRFRGGITSARGHEGENASGLALLTSLHDGNTQPVTTNVFGCSLF